MIRHFADHDEIEDLGSTGGTRVNGRRISNPVALRPGDLVELATVQLRYVDDLGDDTSMSPAVGAEQSGQVSFTVHDQHAHTISNVGRDQYNQYVQHIVVQRDDALRQVAGISRTARVLITIGFGLSGAGVIGFIGSIVAFMASSADDPFADPQFPEVAGIPVFAAAMVVALVGFAFFFGGIIVQLSARRQREQVDRDYPLPAGWPSGGLEEQ